MVHAKGKMRCGYHRIDPTFKTLSNALVFFTAALGGCVFYPQTITEYNPACDTIQRHMKLNSTQVEAFIGCHDRGCAELLVLAGVVSAATFVISGSIAVVGDVVYWLEAQGQCQRRRE